MSNGIRGFSNSTRKSASDDTTNERERFVTVQPTGATRAGLETISMGVYVVGASDRVAEVGSNTSNLKLTGHDIKKGDLIKFKVTSNTIEETGMYVRAVVDADNVTLDGTLSASLTSGDTFDIMRGVEPLLDSSGASTVMVNGGLVAFKLEQGGGAITTNVLKDTVTPANNIPLPVELAQFGGDINVTASELNVQLSHTGGTPDSTQIGDGTETVNVSTSNELQTRDDDANTTLTAVSGKLPATLGQKAKAASLAVTLASDEDNINVDVASSALPTGAATAANQASQIALLPASIGQKAKTGSLAVTLASDEDALAITAASLPLPTGAATETTLAAQSAKLPATLGQKTASASLSIIQASDADIASETTLAAQSAKLPTTLGSKTSAASLSVTVASDQVMPRSKGRTKVGIIRHLYTSTAVTDSAYVELLASTVSEANLMEIFDSSGEVMVIAFGAAASEVDQFNVQPGGNGKVEFNIPASTRISIKAVSDTPVNVGEIDINLYS